MKVRFLTDGESPSFGSFKKDEMRDLEPGVERVFIERGVAEEVIVEEGHKTKKSKKKEVTGNGE